MISHRLMDLLPIETLLGLKVLSIPARSHSWLLRFGNLMVLQPIRMVYLRANEELPSSAEKWRPLIFDHHESQTLMDYLPSFPFSAVLLVNATPLCLKLFLRAIAWSAISFCKYAFNWPLFSLSQIPYNQVKQAPQLRLKMPSYSLSTIHYGIVWSAKRSSSTRIRYTRPPSTATGKSQLLRYPTITRLQDT